MRGNANTNSSNQFIGTSDSVDLVLKTNNSTRIKIKSNGKINLSNLSKGYATELWIDSLGNIFAKAPSTGNICHANYFPLPLPSWQVAVDNIDNQGGFLYTCADDIKVGIGTLIKKNKLDVAGNIAIGSGWAGAVDAPTDGMLVKGNVGIGTSYIPANYKLAVNGKIISEEVFVKLRTSWPDYVFNSDYKLTPLIELKKFINQNNHLPEIKSSEEIENADGISVGETQTILLKKIEELTLYIIQQDEKVNKMQIQIEQLQKK